MSSRSVYPFADWMKALGMGLIVFGHVADRATLRWSPPIYPKQLGVALFVFVCGFLLARDRRPALAVVVRRLFPVCLYAAGCAALITIIGAARGTGLALSNFLPLAGGANVFFDNFPANPTTWYVGTYIHLILLWALVLRRVDVRPSMLVAVAVLEIATRCVLVAVAGRFVAYMLLTNWITVFMLGLGLGARPERDARGRAWVYAAGAMAAVVVCALPARLSGFTYTFPFMTVAAPSPIVGLLMMSAAVSAMYVWTSALIFEATRRTAAQAPAAVRFVARNSLVIFLGHMPIYWGLHPVLVSLGLSFWPRAAVQLVVCILGLGLLSELLVRIVRPQDLRRVLDAWTSGTQNWKKESATA